MAVAPPGQRLRTTVALLTAVAVTAIPAAAPAQTLTVHDEATGDPCSAVMVSGHSVTGGCEFHASGEFGLWTHSFGIEMLSEECAIEFSGHVQSDGDGWLDVVTLADETPGHACTRVACAEASGQTEPWPLHLDEPGAATEEMQIEYCWDSGGGGTVERSAGTFPITQTAAHDYESDFTAPDVRPTPHTASFNRELAGQLHFESTTFELVH